MDQNNNMNKFFNSSFFAQTPQKDNKPGQFSGIQQPSIFGQTQSGFSGAQNPFLQGSGGMKSNTFGTSTPFGGTSTFGGATSNSGGFGQPFSTQQPSTSLTRFGTGGTLGTGNNIFGGTANTIGTNPTQFGGSGNTSTFGTQQQVNNNTFGSGVPNSLQPFSMGASTATQPSIWGQQTTSYNPFGSSQNSSFSNDRSNALGKGFPGLGGGNSGTRDHPYMQRKIREDNGGEVTLMHINGNEGYTQKSVDELRAEDYILGRKPPTGSSLAEPKSIPGFGSSFGGPVPSSIDSKPQSSNIFGATPSNNSFQPFISTGNSKVLQGPTNPGFGNTVAQQPFASQAISQSTPSQPFGTAAQALPSTNSNPFLQTPQQPQSLFGSAGTSPQTPASGGLSFMQPPTAPVQQPFGGGMASLGTCGQQNTQQTKIDPSDPFLLKDIKFEKTEKEHLPLSKVLPKPMFKEDLKPQKISLKFRPPKPPAKEKIYTIPPIEDIKHMKEVHNLIIGFEDKGRIEYLDTVNGSDVTMANIQSKIYFSKESVVVNDPVGVGLNRRARVYVEGVFPYSRSLGDYVRGEQKQFPLKGIQERFLYGLKNDTVKKFVGYEYERGTYVYDVNHF
ncbi:nucleoporin autopeptidase [Encephalitozoon intestinalis ATCC 50506]|uniref:Nucleoporin autopeptidase n=1 Tax=Encephalitozoon intestinalis (strain ATCC 50506) TaxID=876142 RepID=E0S5Q5_ENCIT|nr:nucleoporin autopeptidase [Encephalitozoon intestinalis ATCC 50506]ADM11040.2 nucleoporin autopeptidase [Encephalitozoon intestinalis ATCC 50506]UTX44689.1 nucleoporin autopeptidase [Encephalitozoon intestinalis]